MDTKPKKNVRMKAARALKGLSQEDLAKAAGVTRQTIGMIEAGGLQPILKAVHRHLQDTGADLGWPVLGCGWGRK